MKKNYFLLLFCFIFLCSNAQISSDSDPSFDNKDYSPNISTLFTKQFALQPDGKLIVAGNSCAYKLYNNKYEVTGKNIMRLNKDLSIDNSFNVGSGFSTAPGDIVVQPNGKILACGGFTTYNDKAVKKIIRLNSDGTIDDTFNLNEGGFNSFSVTNIRSIKLQPDGKMIVTGTFFITIYQTFTAQNIMRLNADGSVDKTFRTNFSYETFKLELQNDGKIVRVYKNTFNQEASYKIDRLNPDGSIDTGFTAIEGFGRICSSNTVDYDNMYDCKLAIQSDGKILFGGCYTSFKNLDTRGLMRFNSDGTKDTSFTYVLPGQPMATVKDFVLLPNDKILTHKLVYINSDGSTDNTVIAKLDKNTNSSKVLLIPDNKVIVCTDNTITQSGTSTYTNKFIKLDLTTSEINLEQQPSTFYPGNDIVEKPNGDIVVLGYSKNISNMKYHDGMKLLNKNGNLIYNQKLYQNVFTSTVNDNSQFKKAIVQPDNKIIVSKIESTGANSLVRYNDDFSLDTSFNQVPIYGAIYNLTLLPDGKILALSGNENDPLIRLNSDGSKDVTFSISAKGFNNICYDAIVQGDGKILVAGNFTSLNGKNVNRIVRFNIDGTLDNTFKSDENLSGFIYKLGLQSNGKIIIAGSFEFNSTINKSCVLKRLNIDGTTDTSFTPYYSTKVGHLVRGFLVESTNEILLFTNLNSATEYQANDFKRLHVDGEIDTSFDSGEGFNGNITSIKLQKDGKLLVTGNFSKYKDLWSNGTIRLIGHNNTLSTPDFALENKADSNFTLFPNPVKNVLNITSKENTSITSIQIYNILGESLVDLKNKKTFSAIDISNLNNGIYFIRINSNKGNSTHKFLKN